MQSFSLVFFHNWNLRPKDSDDNYADYCFHPKPRPFMLWFFFFFVFYLAFWHWNWNYKLLQSAWSWHHRREKGFDISDDTKVHCWTCGLSATGHWTHFAWSLNWSVYIFVRTSFCWLRSRLDHLSFLNGQERVRLVAY